MDDPILAVAAVEPNSMAHIAVPLEFGTLGVVLRVGVPTPEPLTLRELAADL